MTGLCGFCRLQVCIKFFRLVFFVSSNRKVFVSLDFFFIPCFYIVVVKLRQWSLFPYGMEEILFLSCSADDGKLLIAAFLKSSTLFIVALGLYNH